MTDTSKAIIAVQRRMLHASDFFMEPGHIIRPSDPSYHNGIKYWERHSLMTMAKLFHDYKPACQLGHDQAVFVSEDIEDLKTIGYNYHDYLYEVEICGKSSRHDISWHDDIFFRELSDEMIPDAAMKYWAGEIRGASEGFTGSFEILAEEAIVISRKAINKNKTGYVQDETNDPDKHPSLKLI